MTTLRRTAWLVVALLWPVALLNYLDRQMLASMKFSVMADIASIGSETNWGKMLGQFKWVYAFLSPVGGYVADAPTLGWRFAFDASGIAGITYAVPLALLLRDAPKSGNTAVVTAPGNSVVQSARELLGNGSFILLVLYFTLPAIAGWVVR